MAYQNFPIHFQLSDSFPQVACVVESPLCGLWGTVGANVVFRPAKFVPIQANSPFPPAPALCGTSENTYNLRTLVGIHFYIIILKLN